MAYKFDENGEARRNQFILRKDLSDANLLRKQVFSRFVQVFNFDIPQNLRQISLETLSNQNVVCCVVDKAF
jgi:hypothetical protein